MKKLFGTDGMRGEAGIFPLDKETIATAASSLTRQFRETIGKRPAFLTGRDTRESGRWIEEAFHAGVLAGGGNCESAGVATTPGVAYLTRAIGFDAGIVVSASHNPFQDNGLKIFSPSGKKIGEETEREIEKDIFEQNYSGFEFAEEIDDSRAGEFREQYLSYLAEEFKGLSLSGFKMVVDCANGASAALAPLLFERFGAEVFAINASPDGRNINKNCGSTHIEGMLERVKAEGADFGVAFDGDADRALFSDAEGNLVDGDATLWVMAQHLKKHGSLNEGRIVATVMSNIGLEVALGSIGVGLLRTAVGDKYVLEELLKSKSSVGGEQSGHIIFPFRSLVGDGMLSALFLLEAVRESGKSLSGMVEGFQRFPQVLVNVKVREKKAFEDVEAIAAAARKIEGRLHGQGRLLLRYSGTENLARVMIEGKNQAEIEEMAHSLADVIKESLG